MKLPEAIAIRICGDSKPLAGMLMTVTIKVHWKNDFNVLCGPTDHTGSVCVSREYVLGEAQKDRELFLMDYGHPEIDATGEIIVRPMGISDLKRAASAYDLFTHSGLYRQGYIEDIKSAIELLTRSCAKELRSEVRRMEGGQDYRIVTQTVSAA